VYVDSEICSDMGLDPKKVESIARRISKAGKEADSMGVRIFSWGNGYLTTKMEDGRSIQLASLDGEYEGGDPTPEEIVTMEDYHRDKG
jgi:hypothetical protein